MSGNSSSKGFSRKRILKDSVDDPPVQTITTAFPSVSEKQVQEIVRLKTTTGLGYRRIGQRLNPPLKKDTVMRVWKMCKQSLMPPKSSTLTTIERRNEQVKGEVAQLKNLRRLKWENEELEKERILLKLQVEGDNLLVSIVEDQIIKTRPETYRKFVQYCSDERLTTAQALQRMGITVSRIYDDFDYAYDTWCDYYHCGMNFLILYVELEIGCWFALPYDQEQNDDETD
jgi:hypothetical protein